MRWIGCVLVVGVLGCGARSGLDVGEEAPPLRRDGGIDTFPCRWSTLGVDVELTRQDATGMQDIVGLVHPTRDELVALVVTLRDRETVRTGAILELTDPPGRITPLEVRQGVRGLAADGDLYLTLTTDCLAEWRDREFNVIESLNLGGREPYCPRPASSVPGALDVVVNDPRVGNGPALRLRAGAPGAPPEPLFGDLRAFPGPIVEAPAGRFMVTPDAATGRFLLYVHHEARDGTVTSIGPIHPHDYPGYGLAPDLLFGGAFLMRISARGPDAMDALSTDPLRAEQVQDLEGLGGGAVSVTMAWDETEVVFVLENGSLAFMPFTGNSVRVVPHVIPRGFDDAQVVLRNGSTLGGVLYARRDGSQRVLVYRPLVCNR